MDFLPLEERVTFKHQETEKLVKVKLLDEEQKERDDNNTPAVKEDAEGDEQKEGEEENSSLVFQVKLDRPMPNGVQINK